MATSSTSEPILRITTPLGKSPAFAVSAFTGREAVSQLFEFQVDLLAPTTEPVAFDKLLGQGVTVTMTLPDNRPRHWHGMVRSVSQGARAQVEDGSSVTAYRLVLVPKLWLLTRRRQSRIFQQQSVPDILKTVLGATASFDTQGTWEKRDYCVQYRETDFEFISRLMEEEGIFYFFKHDESQHTMVVGSTPTAHPTVPGQTSLSYQPAEGGVRPDDRIYTWEKEQTLTAGKVALWDHSFELPTSHLDAESSILSTVTAGTVTHKLAVGGNSALELYDYPGDYAKRFDGVAPGGGDQASDLQKIFQDNRRTADLRMRAEESGALRTHGASTCPQIASGHKFTLATHPDGDGEYIVLDAEHVATSGSLGTSGGKGGGFQYKNRFAATPVALGFRPPRTTPRPHVAGCQTAVVVGPAGEEIFVDKYGRVKVQFHWDRDGKKDANSSCWVRVASTWAGRQWGAIHLPRIGQEVVVDFLEGDPDRPIIVGSVYNAENMPPYVLPDNKTQSGIKSRSSLNASAENFNELRFEDKKGSEQVYLHAEKDFDAVVENDETSKVGRDRTTTITRHDTTVLKNQPKEGDALGEGNQSLTIHKGKQDVTLKEGNQTITLEKGDQATVLKQGNRTLEVTGNDTTTIKTGNRKVTIADGNETLVVEKGNQSVAIKMGNDDLTIDMGNYSIAVKLGNVTIKADVGKITLEALQGIELKSGPSSIKVAPDGVAIAGMTAKVEGTTMTEVKGLMTTVSGSAMLTAKGGVTMIN